LNTILIWNDGSAESYANMKKKVWKWLWIEVELKHFWDRVDKHEIVDHILELNEDKNCHGIMIESPILPRFQYGELIQLVNPKKDIDWLHPMNLWSMLERTGDVILPATPLACIAILEKLVFTIKWLRVTLVWHGRTVGAPLSDMLNNLWATVVSCNHHTPRELLIKECLASNVIITATWVKKIITADMVHKNTIVIDAWIIPTNDTKSWITWDTDYDEVSKIAKYVTPVPGWVWVVTTSIIFQNLIGWIIKQR
jgi:methylenetetrahydrofolate dehydrogenase (NADP+)/methenyltetrahydrofolate cyclohydrolase